MRQCQYCGNENVDRRDFCSNCGTSLMTHQTKLKPEQRNGFTLLDGGQPTGIMELPRSTTGIDGLDQMIGGGFPQGRVILVSGGPGTGKTTMALQFLVNGCIQFGESGIFVSLDEPLKKILQEYGLGRDLKSLIDKGKIAFLEFHSSSGNRFSAEEITTKIKDAANKLHVKRIAIDPLTFISIHFPDIVTRRGVIMGLFDTLTATGATCIVTNEMRSEHENVILLEEYLADGVLRLHSSQVERGHVRTIDVEKMRGTAIDDQSRAYVIEREGIKVISDSDLFSYAAKLFAKQLMGEKASSP